MGLDGYVAILVILDHDKRKTDAIQQRKQKEINPVQTAFPLASPSNLKIALEALTVNPKP